MKLQPRRSFIKQTAALARRRAVHQHCRDPRSTAQAAEPKLGFAICGLGSLSTNQIAPAFAKTKNCKLTGIVTGHPAKAEVWKAKYNIPDKNIYNYETMEKMGDNPDIDVVYVVTPNALHAEHTIKAAKAGKHVLTEKPMEATPEKCREMIDACKAANRMLAVAYRCQFATEQSGVRMRLAREKVFGNLKIIEACFDIKLGDDLTQWRAGKSVVRRRHAHGRGHLCVARPARVTSAAKNRSLVSGMETKTDLEKFKEVDETVTWQAKFPSGVIA